MPSASATAMSVSRSSGSNASATELHDLHQMETDPRNSFVREAQISNSPIASSSSSARASKACHDFLDKELISSESRLSRLPPKVPLSPQPLTNYTDTVAISAFQKSPTTYTSQDVHDFVNSATSSTPSSAYREKPSPLETPVSSFPKPITQHGLNHPIRRPRTSTQVFQSSTDLAAHYGIPQILPPAPRATSHYLPAPPKPQSPQVFDFKTLSANYLNMLSNTPIDSSMTAPSAPAMTATELDAPLIPADPISPAQLQTIADIIASSPQFRDMDSFDNSFDDFLSPLLEDDNTSPSEAAYSDFLNTPLITDDAMLTSPAMEYLDMPMFGGVDDEYTITEEYAQPIKAPAPHLFDNLYTISPSTPALESFDPSNLYAPQLPPPKPSATISPPTFAPRRSRATGIRKGVTPDSLLNEEAPTQPRKYTTPSATSRKELPAVFARKRSRSTAFGEEEDQLDELPPNPTEKDLIEQKRRQNTVAARRSRKRKLEQFQLMEKSRDEERGHKQVWQNRAETLLAMVRAMGVDHPDWPAMESEFADA